MSENVFRLVPKKDVLRGLYLRSGNQCAFPGCVSILIDDEGVFVGQICHIEAAEEGGERFNVKQSNEERRDCSNLLLLCYPHHQVTNDVAKYDVNEMRRIKHAHESKYGDIAQKIGRSISDYTESADAIFPNNLNALNEVLEWRLSEAELKGSLPEVIDFCEKIKRLPIPTRQLLVILINRAKYLTDYSMSGKLGVSLSEIRHVCAIDDTILSEHIQMLDQSGLISEADPEEFMGLAGIRLSRVSSGWDIFEDLKKFSRALTIPLDRMLVDLDFSVWDRNRAA